MTDQQRSKLAQKTDEIQREIRAYETERKARENTERIIEQSGRLWPRLIRSVAT